MWRVSGIITNTAKLSKPTYDLGHGIISAGNAGNFAHLLEIQTEDIQDIVRDKVLKAFNMIGRPVFIEHTGLYIKGLPQSWWVD